MVKDSSLSSPILIRYIMISSRVQIAVEMVAFPSSINVCAFPNHTSVPCDRPAIRIRWEKDCGSASINICIAKSVPNSGIPSAPSVQFVNISGVILSALVFLNKDMTDLSSSGIFCASIPVKSSSIRIMVGSSCPRISSFNKL